MDPSFRVDDLFVDSLMIYFSVFFRGFRGHDCYANHFNPANALRASSTPK